MRLARPDETHTAYLIKKTVLKPDTDTAVTWDEPEQWRLHERRFATQEYFFIEINGDPIGFMARVITDGQMRLNQLFILPQHQGMGVGEFAMREMLAKADQLNVPVRVDVRKENERSRAMCVKLGFVRVADTSTTSDAMIREPVCD